MVVLVDIFRTAKLVRFGLSRLGADDSDHKNLDEGGNDMSVGF